MNSPCVIGIDLGTSAIKTLVLSASGEIRGISEQSVDLEYPQPDWCEMDPEKYWLAVCSSLTEAIRQSGVSKESIKGISFSSQAETLIVVDYAGNPLRKGIVWLDNRSKKEATEIEQNFGRDLINKISGQPEIQPLWPAVRIAWLRKHEPEIFASAYKFLLVEDFILFKLTGQYATEYSISSSCLYLDIEKKCWWPEMLHYLGISEEQLPKLYPSGSIVSKISIEASRITELSTNIPIIAGAYDHAAGAIGAGNIRQGIITETTGTSMAMCVTLDERPNNLPINLPCQIHAVSGKYFLLPYGPTAGHVFKWFRDELISKNELTSEQAVVDTYEQLTTYADSIPPGCEGLTMLPHLAGTGSPEFDANARGVFSGLSLAMTKGHMVRAIMEAVAFMINRNIITLQQFDLKYEAILSLGGASKSSLWNQIKADIIGIPVKTLVCQETPALGAALLAGIGVGIYSSLEEAVKVCLIKESFTPNKTNEAAYQKAFDQYIRLTNLYSGYWKS